jgi:hypothetical protein
MSHVALLENVYPSVLPLHHPRVTPLHHSRVTAITLSHWITIVHVAKLARGFQCNVDASPLRDALQL